MNLDFDAHVHWEKLNEPCESHDRIHGETPSGVHLYSDFISQTYRTKLLEWINTNNVFMEIRKGIPRGYFSDHTPPMIIGNVESTPQPKWSRYISHGLHTHKRFQNPANLMQVMQYEAGRGNNFHVDIPDYGNSLFLLNIIGEETAAKTAEVCFGFRNPLDGRKGHITLRDGDAIELLGAEALRLWYHCIHPVTALRYSVGWRDMPIGNGV
ncbi:MAG TPA: hypothetical protein VJB60_01910 [Candidatus Peribacterales bacterium]|nr:hypothetical protein [Candidatus Peribacterales bacterium]